MSEMSESVRNFQISSVPSKSIAVRLRAVQKPVTDVYPFFYLLDVLFWFGLELEYPSLTLAKLNTQVV